MPVRDHLIDGALSPLAVRDHGGSGTPILLLHGATRALSDWDPIATDLATDHRVVAMDLRNHGRSGDGPWLWDGVLDDVQAVIDACGLDRPAIVGHSLGGMTAALYNASRGGARCAINFDGFSLGRVERYPGIDPDEVRGYWRDMLATLDAERPYRSGPIDTAVLAEYRVKVYRDAAIWGCPPEITSAWLERSVRARPDGRHIVHPDLDTCAAMNEAMMSMDWFATFENATAPILIYNCVRPEVVDPHADLDPTRFVTAYRMGLRRDLAALAARASQVRIRTVDTAHMIIIDLPHRLTGEIREFVDSVAG